jgi:hypothetical protein
MLRLKMGKTYRREKNVWDDNPNRFERRTTERKNSQKMKEYAYQERRKQKNKIRETEHYEEL